MRELKSEKARSEDWDRSGRSFNRHSLHAVLLAKTTVDFVNAWSLSMILATLPGTGKTFHIGMVERGISNSFFTSFILHLVFSSRELHEALSLLSADDGLPSLHDLLKDLVVEHKFRRCSGKHDCVTICLQ